MKQIIIIAITIIVAITSAPSSTYAQTENPRGIYKMTSITGKNGRQAPALDQYKVCTDSITLMVNIYGSSFTISNNDRKPLNYTGEATDSAHATATRIYASNAKKFSLKWWSTNPNHQVFPHNDWCIEEYESDKYSPNGKRLFDNITRPIAQDKNFPMIGTWRRIGIIDELHNAKKEIKLLLEELQEGKNTGNFTYYAIDHSSFVYVPSISVFGSTGYVAPITFDSKGTFAIGNKQNQHYYLIGKSYIAIAMVKGRITDYEIWERMPDNTIILEQILKTAMNM